MGDDDLVLVSLNGVVVLQRAGLVEDSLLLLYLALVLRHSHKRANGLGVLLVPGHPLFERDRLRRVDQPRVERLIGSVLAAPE